MMKNLSITLVSISILLVYYEKNHIQPSTQQITELSATFFSTAKNNENIPILLYFEG